MYSLLCAFISQYSNKVDLTCMGEAQMAASPIQGGPRPPFLGIMNFTKCEIFGGPH